MGIGKSPCVSFRSPAVHAPVLGGMSRPQLRDRAEPVPSQSAWPMYVAVGIELQEETNTTVGSGGIGHCSGSGCGGCSETSSGTATERFHARTAVLFVPYHTLLSNALPTGANVSWHSLNDLASGSKSWSTWSPCRIQGTLMSTSGCR